MNARRKAKYYKRKYDELLKQPITFTVEQHKIDTLQFERFYPEALIAQETIDLLRKIVVRDVANALADKLDRYIDYRTVYEPHMGRYRFFGKVQIVVNE